PAPSLPERRAADAPGTPIADESAILRGDVREAPPTAPVPPSAPPPVAPAAPSAPAPTVPEPPVAPPAEAPVAPAQPAVPPPAAPEPPVAPPPIAPQPIAPPEPIDVGVPTVRKPALATDVRGFGDLTPVVPAQLPVGGRAIVYFELAGWHSPPREDGQFVTEATYAIQVLDSEGHPQWSDAPQRAKDVSRVVRTDLFVTRLITLPASLRPGQYALRIVGNDTASGAQSVVTMPFEIVAEPAK
ncbi:MAG: hypothetical protein JNK53_04475, partial [Phycisphaerae bacterium]|nr:hypothetical protein [Phycisphaerae bacterium]